MKKIWISSLICMLMTSVNGFAIDRDAKSVETAAIVVSELDNVDVVGVDLWGEKAFEEEDWAFLFKAGYGEASPEDARPVDYLKLGFGFKYYLMELTSLEATGEVIAYDFDLDNDTVSAGVGIKHRFVPAGKGVAPYARAALQYRENYSFDNTLPEADDLRDLVFTFGGGVEFKMSESLSMVFDLVYSESEPTDDDFDDLDGVSGYLGLQYYWFE